jgi:hypothetical protein
METIDGQMAFSIVGTQRVIGGSRSSVYRLIADKKLDVIKVEGLGARVTAQSIRRLLGLASATEPAPGGADSPKQEPPPRRRGRPRRVGRPQIGAAGACKP